MPNQLTKGVAQVGKMLAKKLGIASGGDINLDKGTATATSGAATLNQHAGKITSEALTTAAGADYTLTLTNSLIVATSIILITLDNGTNTIIGLAADLVTPGAGSAVIKVRNTHATTALNGTIIIGFVVLN